MREIILSLVVVCIAVSTYAQTPITHDSDVEITGRLTVGETGDAGLIYLRRGSDGNINGQIGFRSGGTESHNLSFLSTSGNGYMTFLTNSGGIIERLRIANNGYIGIGTTGDPLSKLHVSNGNSGGTAHGYSDLTVEDDDNGMISILTGINKIGYFGFADTDDDYVGGMQYEHSDDRLVFRTNNRTSDLTIDQNGKIGLGTKEPIGDLHLYGLSRRMIFSSLSSGQEETARIEFWENHVGIEDAANAHFSIQYDGSGDQLRFRGKKSGTELDVDYLAIKRNGNVGIGTTSPDELLTVNGTIHTSEVRVDLLVPAPDYVFAADYELKTLEETNQYILENHHLPGIPSAKEMEANGVELGDMNMKLLEKIEELTLHLISQQKLIENLFNQVENQQEEINQIKSVK